MDDIDGWRTGTATAYNNWAIGWQHWFSPQVEVRPEVAWYHALNAPAFDNGTKHAITVVSGDLSGTTPASIPKQDQRPPRRGR